MVHDHQQINIAVRRDRPRRLSPRTKGHSAAGSGLPVA
jgi:hypothetical protein